MVTRLVNKPVSGRLQEHMNPTNMTSAIAGTEPRLAENVGGNWKVVRTEKSRSLTKQ